MPVNLAVTVLARSMTLSLAVSNVSSLLVFDAGIVMLVGRVPVVRLGPVSLTLTFSVRSFAGAGAAVTVKRTGLPSTTESVTAVMITEFCRGPSLTVTVTVAESGDPMRYVVGLLVTPVNVAVTVPALWATVSSVVINVSTTLPAGAEIVTSVGLSVVRMGEVCVTLTLSSRSTAGAGAAVTLKSTGSPSTTESVTAVMVTEFAGGGGLMMTGSVMTGPVMAGPVGAVDDAVTVTEAEPAVPTLYPSPSVTDAVIVPSGLVGAVGTVRIAVPDSASIVIVAVAGSSSASSTPLFLYATCTVRSAIGAGEAFTVYDTGSPAATMSESARIVTVGWGGSGVMSRVPVVGSGTTAPGDAPLHPASASEIIEISTNSPYGTYEPAKREFPKRHLHVIGTPTSRTTCPQARLTLIIHELRYFAMLHQRGTGGADVQ